MRLFSSKLGAIKAPKSLSQGGSNLGDSSGKIFRKGVVPCLYRPFYSSKHHQILHGHSQDHYQEIPTSFSSIGAFLRKSSFLFILVIAGIINNTDPGTLKILRSDSYQLYLSNATIFIGIGAIKAPKSLSQGGSNLGDSSGKIFRKGVVPWLYRPFYSSKHHQILHGHFQDQYQEIPTSFSSIGAFLRKSSFLFILVIAGTIHNLELWKYSNPIVISCTFQM